MYNLWCMCWSVCILFLFVFVADELLQMNCHTGFHPLCTMFVKKDNMIRYIPTSPVSWTVDSYSYYDSTKIRHELLWHVYFEQFKRNVVTTITTSQELPGSLRNRYDSNPVQPRAMFLVHHGPRMCIIMCLGFYLIYQILCLEYNYKKHLRLL